MVENLTVLALVFFDNFNIYFRFNFWSSRHHIHINIYPTFQISLTHLFTHSFCKSSIILMTLKRSITFCLNLLTHLIWWLIISNCFRSITVQSILFILIFAYLSWIFIRCLLHILLLMYKLLLVELRFEMDVWAQSSVHHWLRGMDARCQAMVNIPMVVQIVLVFTTERLVCFPGLHVHLLAVYPINNGQL